MSTILKNELNIFFKEVCIKKQYLQELRSQSRVLKDSRQHGCQPVLQNFCNRKHKTFFDNSLLPTMKNNTIVYVVTISFSRVNTFMHVTDVVGNLKFFCSAGYLKFKGRDKKLRRDVLRDFYTILMSKLKFLKKQPIALHLKNVAFRKHQIIKKLKKRFFIKIVRIFSLFPHNGCRLKKTRRKKIRSRKNK